MNSGKGHLGKRYFVKLLINACALFFILVGWTQAEPLPTEVPPGVTENFVLLRLIDGTYLLKFVSGESEDLGFRENTYYLLTFVSRSAGYRLERIKETDLREWIQSLVGRGVEKLLMRSFKVSKLRAISAAKVMNIDELLRGIPGLQTQGEVFLKNLSPRRLMASRFGHKQSLFPLNPRASFVSRGPNAIRTRSEDLQRTLWVSLAGIGGALLGVHLFPQAQLASTIVGTLVGGSCGTILGWLYDRRY